jgi:hypothetical protein
MLGASCVAQTSDREFAFDEPAGATIPGTAAQPGQPATPAATGGDSSNRFGIGVRVSTLGIGGEFAYKLTHRFNVRAGFNVMSLSHTFNKDGVTYDGSLKFRSVDANLDWFFLGPLHLGPGLLLYNGNTINATASVSGGQTFTLNSTTYESSSSTPLNGSATLSLNKVAPSILFGVGNMIPRNGRHFSGHFEIGGIYEGSPNIALNFSGNACAQSSGPCNPGTSVSTIPGFASNLAAA